MSKGTEIGELKELFGKPVLYSDYKPPFKVLNCALCKSIIMYSTNESIPRIILCDVCLSRKIREGQDESQD